MRPGSGVGGRAAASVVAHRVLYGGTVRYPAREAAPLITWICGWAVRRRVRGHGGDARQQPVAGGQPVYWVWVRLGSGDAISPLDAPLTLTLALYPFTQVLNVFLGVDSGDHVKHKVGSGW